jgi:hypothetical protein
MSIELIGFENLPNVYVEKVSITEYGDNGINVKVDVKLHDMLENPIWFDSSKFLTKMLRVGLYFSENQEESERISSGETPVSSLKKIHSKTLFKPKIMEDKIVFDLQFSKVFSSDISHLNIYCFCFIDKEQIMNSVGVRMPRDYYGPTKAERIFDNNRVVDATYIFLTQNGEYWSGPVHSHQGAFMAGSYHSDRKHEALNRLLVRNTKIKDLRETRAKKDDPSQTAVNLSSDLFVSYNSDTDVNALFMINVKTILMQKTKFGAFLKTASSRAISEILENFNIKVFSVERQRVQIQKQSTFLRSAREKTKKIYNKKSIVKSYDQNSTLRNTTRYERKGYFDIVESDLRSSQNNTRETNEIFTEELQDYKKICSVSELFFEYGAEIRTFQFNDYELTSNTAGQYKYKASFSFVDPVKSFLSSVFAGMLLDDKQISRYEGFASRGVQLDTIDVDTLGLVEAYVKNYSYLYNTTDRGRRRMTTKLLSLLDPATATLGTIKKFKKQNQNLINQFIKLTNYDPTSLKDTSRLINIKSKEATANRIVYEKTFDKVITPSFNKTSFGYLDESKKTNMKMFTKQEISQVAKEQTENNFAGQPNTNTYQIPSNIMSKLNDILRNSTLYFGPKFLNGFQNVFLNQPDAGINHQDFNFGLGEANLESTNNKNMYTVNEPAVPQSEEAEEESHVSAGKIFGEDQEFVSYTETESEYPVVKEQSNHQIKFGNYFSGYVNNRTFNATIDAVKNLTEEEASLVPNQLKAVILGASKSTRNQYVTSEGDLLANPKTNSYYEVNNFSVKKLIYVNGFKKDPHGNILLNKPLYKNMSLSNFNLLNKPVLCFLQAYTNNKFKISDDNEVTALDSVFIMTDSDLTVKMQTNVSEDGTIYNIEDISYEFMNSEIIVQTNAEINVPSSREEVNTQATQNINTSVIQGSSY